MDNSIIARTDSFVKSKLSREEGGHDYWHTYRVWQNAKKIHAVEGGSLIIIELASLLHDVADSKFHNGDETVGPKMATRLLKSANCPEEIMQHVVKIIENISFKGGYNKGTFKSQELDIVQDADRLEAIGAIGIARTFNYGGHKGNLIFDPMQVPNLNMTKEEYKKGGDPTINHFYEKLLLLKDLMNTKTGMTMATERHKYMVDFLQQFYKEASFDPSDTKFAI